MNDVHMNGGALSGAPPAGTIYENAGFHEPRMEWSSVAILEITYIDNIQVVVDRNERGIISLSLWQIGDDTPFDRFASDIPERYFVVRNLETKLPLVWTLEQILDEVNRHRTDAWSDFTPFNWHRGWNEFVEGRFYQLISPEPRSREEAERAQALQARRFDPDHPSIREPVHDGESSHLFTFIEIYELRAFANGFIKAADQYVEVRKLVGDDWISYLLPSGEVVEIQVSLNEDSDSPNYNRLEAFAYRTRREGNSEKIADTSDCVRLI